MRLLRDKIHLDGELLLLVLLQRPNVVRQAPSQDNEFYALTYRLIIHSLGPMFPPHQVCSQDVRFKYLKYYGFRFTAWIQYMQWQKIGAMWILERRKQSLQMSLQAQACLSQLQLASSWARLRCNRLPAWWKAEHSTNISANGVWETSVI